MKKNLFVALFFGALIPVLTFSLEFFLTPVVTSSGLLMPHPFSPSFGDKVGSLVAGLLVATAVFFYRNRNRRRVV